MVANRSRYAFERKLPAEAIKVGDEVLFDEHGDYMVVFQVKKLRGIETRLYVHPTDKPQSLQHNRSVVVYNRSWFFVRRPVKP